MQQSTLKKRTLSGLFWSFSGLTANQIIQFIMQVMLARLLVPEDFGIIGMITVFIAVSQTLVDSGFANALIREKESSQEDYSTVFFFSLFMSVLLYIILFICAGAISSFYEEPRLVAIIRVVAVILIINSFGLIPGTMMVKCLDFKTQTEINVISSILSGVVAITFAFLGFGVWSLVIRTISMQLIQSILLCLCKKWIPSLVFKMDSFKRLYGFGCKLMISGVIDTLYQNLYYLIIGKVFLASQLGYYTNAQKLRDTASQSITISVQKVSYPVLSSIKEDKERLRSAYRKMIKATVFVTFPLLLGLAAVAKPLILIIFGEKWISSVSYFQILCLAGMLFPLHAINLDILEVKGRSDLFLGLEILKKTIGLISIAVVLLFKLGIEGMLWAAVINSYIAYFINSYYSADLISYSTKEQLKDITPVFIGSFIMAAVVYFIGIVLPVGNFLKLIVQIVCSIALFMGICKILKIKELEEIPKVINMFLNRLKCKGETK